MNARQIRGTDFLYHYGVKGQKWHIRRYQNPDGTLTELGKRRLYKSMVSSHRANNRFNSRKSRDFVMDGIDLNIAKRSHERIRSLVSGHEYASENDAYSKFDRAERNAQDKEYRLAKSQNRKFNPDNSRKNLEKELKDKYNKSIEEMIADVDSEEKRNVQKGKQIASELLGKYADKKVAKNWTASEYLDSAYLRR